MARTFETRVKEFLQVIFRILILILAKCFRWSTFQKTLTFLAWQHWFESKLDFDFWMHVFHLLKCFLWYLRANVKFISFVNIANLFLYSKIGQESCTCVSSSTGRCQGPILPRTFKKRQEISGEKVVHFLVVLGIHRYWFLSITVRVMVMVSIKVWVS